MGRGSFQQNIVAIIGILISSYSTAPIAASTSSQAAEAPNVKPAQTPHQKTPQSSHSTVTGLPDSGQTAPGVDSDTSQAIYKRKASVDRAVTAASSLAIGASYRHGDFDFNIASDPTGTQTPNILSELKWDDISILAVDAKAKMRFENDIELRGDFTYGLIVEGNNQDSDYLGDNRTNEFSRSNNSTDDGSIIRTSIGVGYSFDLAQSANRSAMRLTPMLGYAIHQQNFKIKNGYQTISRPPLEMPLGPILGLNSSYETDWRGPWVGLELALLDQNSMSLIAAVEYHWADYEAHGNWNLRKDLKHPVSFLNTANGEGLVASLDWIFSRSEDWSWSLGVGFERWKTDPGKHRVFFIDDTHVNTQLNEVNWKSWGISLEMKHAF
ncbi:MAG: hypothetical protein MI754_12400 [Chromatiales bacterium]|nr:hypothetical protein [Chromatiales bacterium]